ncbi:MAG: carboxylating nicotinate-nucleotide diphosphorylase [Candidatus Marinimicrobia bacterium]|nr:carboxylating nicotinate-nucleotide diphosphorylase [Candidatus Neomarinimicrobiota bacterium]
MKELDRNRIDKIIRDALDEDIRGTDVTSLAMQTDCSAEARIVSKQHGILAGIDVAKRVFELHDPDLRLACEKGDGAILQSGDTVLTVSGKGQSILAAERTALNLICRMSGIATVTARYVEQVRGTACRILDTRKTTPNLRMLDKYAVRCGGGHNHRFGLYDMILIKENHIRWAGGVRAALEAAVPYARARSLKVEIEVTNLEELKTALSFPVDMIMLDHFSPGELREAVSLNASGVMLEASGNVSLETVGGIARSGVDVISVGALTHSAPCFDFSLLFHE